MPGPRLIAAVAGAGLVGVFASYGLRDIFNLGLGALAVLLALKPLEMRSHRDRMVAVYLSLFLVLGSVHYTEALLATAYVGFMVVLLLTTLAELTRRRGVRLVVESGKTPSGRVSASLRLSFKLVLMAAPVAVVLFLVFPRLPQGLLGYQALEQGGGFGNTMAPGSLSAYALDNILDFRVRFHGAATPRQLQYWRAKTLSVFDGRAWREMEQWPLKSPPQVPGEGVGYTILLEPRTDRVLPVLDTVRAIESDLSGGIRTDMSVRANGDLRMRVSYEAESVPGANVPPVEGSDRGSWFLQLPNGNPRTMALALEWRTLPLAQRALRGLQFFRDNPFVYTLNPPELGRRNTVDAFLFETQAGFCEHFASAYAVLMRAAEVPARVVLGYQGGEYNTLDDYLMVRRTNAHAWVEVLLPGRGWVRADPTAAVSPERVELGVQEALRRQGNAAFSRFLQIDGVRQVVLFARQAWDMLSFRWQTWVLGYDFQRQISFLSRLGIDFTTTAGRLLAMGVTLVFLVLAGVAYHHVWSRSRRQAVSRSVALYRRFEKRMARIGLPRQPHEPPEAYAEAVAARRPDLADAVHAITALYVRARYGPDDGAQEARLAQLEHLLRGFQPKECADGGG